MQRERPQHIFARQALTAQGWQRNVLVETTVSGQIVQVQANSSPPAGAVRVDILLPGLANVHSHAFQRAMAGLTEIAAQKGKENFWTWREVMYDFALRLNPEQIGTIARYLYIELLKHGYTAVAEFHYLHNDVDGKPYASITELSDQIVQAARDAGIFLTHLPVLYETSNFGGKAATERQRRFLHTPDSFISLLADLKKKYGNTEGFHMGIAPHSLRAVKPQSLNTILSALPELGMEKCPIHIHAAEQEKEVNDCLSWSSKRPVEWLLDNAPVDQHWCFIHATHMSAEETFRLAASGAAAGLCPTTEANLGDGIFAAEAYLHAKGSFGIGSDSNICVSPWEELRQLEYAQRLQQRKRAVLFEEGTPSIGRTLFIKAAAGGARALGIRAGAIETGFRADMIALSLNHPLFAGRKEDRLLDTLMFAASPPPLSDVFVGGRRVISNGIHPKEEEMKQALHQTLQDLLT